VRFGFDNLKNTALFDAQQNSGAACAIANTGAPHSAQTVCFFNGFW
jgi:hypothetical protein